MASALVPGSKRSGFEPWGLFLEGPEKFPHPESRSIISNLMITEGCFMTEVTFIQDVSGVYTALFLDTDLLKMALQGPKSLRGFRETCPWSGTLCFLLVFSGKARYSHSASLHPGV